MQHELVIMKCDWERQPNRPVLRAPSLAVCELVLVSREVSQLVAAPSRAAPSPTSSRGDVWLSAPSFYALQHSQRPDHNLHESRRTIIPEIATKTKHISSEHFLFTKLFETTFLLHFRAHLHVTLPRRGNWNIFRSLSLSVTFYLSHNDPHTVTTLAAFFASQYQPVRRSAFDIRWDIHLALFSFRPFLPSPFSLFPSCPSPHACSSSPSGYWRSPSAKRIWVHFSYKHLLIWWG